MGLNIGRLGPDLKMQIENYKINSHLIGKKLEPMDSFQKSFVRKIDRRIRFAFPTTREMTVYSGKGWIDKNLKDEFPDLVKEHLTKFNEDITAPAKKIRECRNLKEGDTFTLPTYLSAQDHSRYASWSVRCGEEPVRLNIVVPRGSKLYSEGVGLDMDLSEIKEYTFPRNSKFKCINHDIYPVNYPHDERIQNRHHITLEYIKPTLKEKLKNLFTKLN